MYTILITNKAARHDSKTANKLGVPRRWISELDSEGFPVQFETANKALQYLLQNHSLDYAMVANVAVIRGDVDTGFFIQRWTPDVTGHDPSRSGAYF